VFASMLLPRNDAELGVGQIYIVNIVTLFSSNIDKYGINGKATAHSRL